MGYRGWAEMESINQIIARRDVLQHFGIFLWMIYSGFQGIMILLHYKL